MSNELERFTEHLFGESDGYVYSPIRKLDTGAWHQYFYKWPAQKGRLHEHIRSRSRRSEVYIGPALYNGRNVAYEHVTSSRTVWAEFDGELPENLAGLPQPSLRIQSSTKGHEHWYWQLDEECTDAAVVQLINKKLAYTLGADYTWDITRVLRPPTSIHHESGKVVSRVSEPGNSSSLEDFAHIEDPSIADIEISIDQLGDMQWIMGMYKWDIDALDLFLKPEMPVGTRSSGLTRLAFSCSEMGMSNEEIVTVLKQADDRWKKYAHREDQLKRLIGIVKYTRSIKQSDQIKAAGHTLEALRFEDFIRTEIRIDWIVQGILPVAGQAVLFGEAGCGKTTLALRAAMAVAKGKDYLKWTVLEKKRVLFVSAEMPHEELTEFFEDMHLIDTSSLQENFFIYPIGHGFPLNNVKNQATLLNLLDKHSIEILIIDSLSVVAGGSTSDDQVIIKFNEFINKEVRTKRRIAVMHIHHPRKADNMNDRANVDNLSSLYGSHFIAANALTVIGMARNKHTDAFDTAKLNYVKGRYFKEDHHLLTCTDNRDFEVREHEPKTKSKPKPDTTNEGSGLKIFRFNP